MNNMVRFLLVALLLASATFAGITMFASPQANAAETALSAGCDPAGCPPECKPQDCKPQGCRTVVCARAEQN